MTQDVILLPPPPDHNGRGHGSSDESCREVDKPMAPMSVYHEVLLPLMKSSGFEYVYEVGDEHRYHTRFLHKTTLPADRHGHCDVIETYVDVVGIPISTYILILHGIIVGTNPSEEPQDVKLKFRCLPSSAPIDMKHSDCRRMGADHSSYNHQGILIYPEIPHLTEEQKESMDYKTRIKMELQQDFVFKLMQIFSVQLDDLPLEIKIRILSTLPLQSILAMSKVNSEWRDVANDEQLWKMLCKQHYPDVYHKRVIGQSWKVLFKDEYRRQRLMAKRKQYAENHDTFFGSFPALPPSPLILPLMPPPFLPMLPGPIDWIPPYHHFSPRYHDNDDFLNPAFEFAHPF